MPFGILFTNIAFACNGMSGLDQASCAGERSSVFVSPSTLKTIAFISLGNADFFKNQSPFAHDSISFIAALLPDFTFSLTS